MPILKWGVRTVIMSHTETTIRGLVYQDIGQIVSSFEDMGWNRGRALFELYLTEQHEGARIVLVAHRGNEFAGYVTIQWESKYPAFQEGRIPEIKDLNVIERFRDLDILTDLMDKAESMIAPISRQAGIGVGLTPDYGAAQRLYVMRGYIPDGRGMFQRMLYPEFGEEVTVDDDMVLYFTKQLS
jgi:hypothetical protein